MMDRFRNAASPGRGSSRGLIAGTVLAAAILAPGAQAAVPALPDPTQPQDQAGPPPGPPGPEDEAGDIQETLEIYMIAKMKRALGLTRDQEEKVVPLIQDLSEARRRFHRERRLALMMIRPLAEDPNSADEEIRTVLTRLDQIENGFRTREARATEQIRAALTPRQQAQFIIFQERFRVEMQQRLRQIRDAGPPGRFGPSPGGPRRREPSPPPIEDE